MEDNSAIIDRLIADGTAPIEPGTHHIVMTDPEGNEFCVQ